MVATVVQLNERIEKFEIPIGEGTETVYTVPTGKVAKITIDYLAFTMGVNSSNFGGYFRVFHYIKIGALKFGVKYSTQAPTTENLNGTSLTGPDTHVGFGFWEIVGEKIVPREDNFFLKTTASRIELSRIPVTSSDTLDAPRKLTRTWLLSAGETIVVGAQREATLTFNSSSYTFQISGDIVLEDA